MADMVQKITNVDELRLEETRLKEVLRLKREQIKVDLQELKEEINPVLKVTKILGKIISPDVQRHAAAHVGTNVAIDWITKKLLPGGFILQSLLPKVVKNYTSHYVDKAVDKAAPALRNFGNKLTAYARNGKEKNE